MKRGRKGEKRRILQRDRGQKMAFLRKIYHSARLTDTIAVEGDSQRQGT